MLQNEVHLRGGVIRRVHDDVQQQGHRHIGFIRRKVLAVRYPRAAGRHARSPVNIKAATCSQAAAVPTIRASGLGRCRAGKSGDKSCHRRDIAGPASAPVEDGHPLQCGLAPLCRVQGNLVGLPLALEGGEECYQSLLVISGSYSHRLRKPLRPAGRHAVLGTSTTQ